MVVKRDILKDKGGFIFLEWSQRFNGSTYSEIFSRVRICVSFTYDPACIWYGLTNFKTIARGNNKCLLKDITIIYTTCGLNGGLISMAGCGLSRNEAGRI